MRRYRNGDRDLRELERAYLADPTDLVAYEALLAARLRAGIPVDDPRTPPSSVEAYALLIEARVRSGVTTRPRVVMAARLGHAGARLAAPEWAGQGEINWAEDTPRQNAITALGREIRKITSFACDCAERVLGVFEGDHPDDMRPRAAIEAARAWVLDPSAINKKAAEAARAAAYAAASHISYAAASAAASAADAYAATYAAAAASAATAADADADAAAERLWQQERLAQYLVGDVTLPPPIKKTAWKRFAKS